MLKHSVTSEDLRATAVGNSNQLLLAISTRPRVLPRTNACTSERKRVGNRTQTRLSRLRHQWRHLAWVAKRTHAQRTHREMFRPIDYEGCSSDGAPLSPWHVSLRPPSDRPAHHRLPQRHQMVGTSAVGHATDLTPQASPLMPTAARLRLLPQRTGVAIRDRSSGQREYPRHQTNSVARLSAIPVL